MTGKGNYHIDWDDFTTTSSERFRDLVGKKEFSDVTLVSNDGTRIPSHQVILASYILKAGITGKKCIFYNQFELKHF